MIYIYVCLFLKWGEARRRKARAVVKVEKCRTCKPKHQQTDSVARTGARLMQRLPDSHWREVSRYSDRLARRQPSASHHFERDCLHVHRGERVGVGGHLLLGSNAITYTCIEVWGGWGVGCHIPMDSKDMYAKYYRVDQGRGHGTFVGVLLRSLLLTPAQCRYTGGISGGEDGR